MVERGDLLTLHEPFCNIADHGETDVQGRTFDSVDELLAWLCDGTEGLSVFVKDTTDRRHQAVLASRRFLAEARHAFLIRRPDEIAASYFALRPEMESYEVGVEALYEMYEAVSATGNRPVVIDSDDLITNPAATMQAYCAAVGLPFLAESLSWDPGERPEWRRSARWHTDAAASSAFEPSTRAHEHTAQNSDLLARFAAHHQPYYERLRANRLVIDATTP